MDTLENTLKSQPTPAEYQNYAKAMRLTFMELTSQLNDVLGTKIVAYLGGVKETRAVREWISGEREASDSSTKAKFSLALRLAKLIAERDSAEVAQSWFLGLNPMLHDAAPAKLIREGDLELEGPKVLEAARQFVAAG